MPRGRLSSLTPECESTVISKTWCWKRVTRCRANCDGRLQTGAGGRAGGAGVRPLTCCVLTVTHDLATQQPYSWAPTRDRRKRPRKGSHANVCSSTAHRRGNMEATHDQRRAAARPRTECGWAGPRARKPDPRPQSVGLHLRDPSRAGRPPDRKWAPGCWVLGSGGDSSWGRGFSLE